MSKKHKPYYCFINENYLKNIFSDEQLKTNKFAKRPFIGFEDSLILIVLPEQTIHNNKKFDLCYYFEDKTHFLSISSLLYVPHDKRRVDKYWNNKEFNIQKLNEIENNYWILKRKINKCLALIEHSQAFKDAHTQIIESRNICKQELTSVKQSKEIQEDPEPEPEIQRERSRRR